MTAYMNHEIEPRAMAGIKGLETGQQKDSVTLSGSCGTVKPIDRISSIIDIKNGMAHCPAHEDKNRSLSITEGDDGKVLLHCHAGCSTEEIVRAMGLTMSDLFFSDEKKHETGRRTHNYDGYRKTIISFSDGSKTAFYERYENDTWIKGLNGHKQTLYNSGALKSPGIKLLSESEKDADQVNLLGLIALSYGGAENWKPYYADELAGQEVALLTHNDDAGKKSALKAAKDLTEKGCPVRIIPGNTWGPHKGADVADWIQAGHTCEDLEEIIESTQIWTPGEDEPDQEAGQDDEPDFTPKEWPTLNKKALYGISGKVVEIATRHSEADPAAVLATFLVRMAAEIGPNPSIWIGDSKHYARINAVITGDSSKARKGTSAKPIDRILRHREGNYSPARVSPGPLSSGEGLVYAVRDEVKAWKVVDKKKNLMDWVVEDPGVTDKRLCVIDEEFGAALSCTKREGNTLSTNIRQAWDHGNIEPLTKSNRIKATRAHICIVTHITNAELQQKMHTTEALNGFGNRMLWVCARRQGFVARPRPMPSDEVEALHNQIIEVVRTAQSKDFSSIQFSANTWDLWEEVYPKLSEDHHGYSGAIINRAEAQVVRLSLIYALFDEQSIVEPCHLEAALAFWDYCQDSALYIFGDREGDAITDKIINALRERDLSATDISNLFHRNISSTKIQAALQDLLNSKKVSFYKKTNGSRKPTTFYHANEINEINTRHEDNKFVNSSNSRDDICNTDISGDEVVI